MLEIAALGAARCALLADTVLGFAKMERATGIEPVSEAWEAAVLPLNYARRGAFQRPFSNFLSDALPNALPHDFSNALPHHPPDALARDLSDILTRT